MYPYCFEHSISSSSFVASYNICRVISNNLLADISHFHSVVFKEHSGRVHQGKKGVIKTTLHDARMYPCLRGWEWAIPFLVSENLITRAPNFMTCMVEKKPNGTILLGHPQRYLVSLFIFQTGHWHKM